MPRVLNLETGFEHDVPEGHWSLGNDAYEVLTPEPSFSWRLNHKGGGWYEILRDDEVLDEIRGAEAAEDRLLELRGE